MQLWRVSVRSAMHQVFWVFSEFMWLSIMEVEPVLGG